MGDTQRVAIPSSNEFAPWRDESAQPLIRFENVTTPYGDFVAIENLALAISERKKLGQVDLI